MTIPSEADQVEMVRGELHRVLTSPQFDASDRNRRFLEYVVGETLAGRSDRIKAYSIATAVFGRDVGFDGQRDPIVRMEASRLRRSLERFYLTDGKYSSVRILMPKGGYVPQFPDNVLTSPAGVTSADSYGEAAGDGVPSIHVGKFAVEGDPQFRACFGEGFVRDVVVALTRHPELEVIGPHHHRHELSSGGEEAWRIQPDFLLSGGIVVHGDTIDVKALLVDARSERVLWGGHLHDVRGQDDFLDVRDRLANDLVEELAQPFGVVFSELARRSANKDFGVLTQFEILVRFHEYRRTYDREQFGSIRNCLEQMVIANPRNAEVFACLSQVYLDGYRFGFARGEPPAVLLNRAREFARRAIEIEPRSSRGHHSLGVAHWFHQDVTEAIRAIETGLECNPRSSELLADLALFKCLRADWDNAVPRLISLFEKGRPVPSSYQLGLSLWHFANGRFDHALTAARKIEAPYVTHGYVAEAISLIRLGSTQEAKQTIGRILKVNPNFVPSNPLADLAGGNLESGLSEAITTAVVDAGSRQAFGDEAGAR